MAIDRDELNERPGRLAGDPGPRRTPEERGQERSQRRDR